MTTTILLPWPPTELWPNRRFHWRKKAAVAKGYRRDCAWLTHHAERINNLLDERHPTYVPSALAGAMS